MKYYVYGLVYPEGHHWAGEFAYIGKGHGNRIEWQNWVLSHPRANGSLRMTNNFMMGLLKRYGALPHVILEYFVTEQGALDFEAEKIKEFGRRNNRTGKLCNLTDGHDQVIRRKLNRRGNRFGAKHTKEAKLKMREAKLGRKLSVEHIRNVQIRTTGLKRSVEFRQNAVLTNLRKHYSEDLVQELFPRHWERAQRRYLARASRDLEMAAN